MGEGDGGASWEEKLSHVSGVFFMSFGCVLLDSNHDSPGMRWINRWRIGRRLQDRALTRSGYERKEKG